MGSSVLTCWRLSAETPLPLWLTARRFCLPWTSPSMGTLRSASPTLLRRWPARTSTRLAAGHEKLATIPMGGGGGGGGSGAGPAAASGGDAGGDAKKKESSSDDGDAGAPAAGIFDDGGDDY